MVRSKLYQKGVIYRQRLDPKLSSSVRTLSVYNLLLSYCRENYFSVPYILPAVLLWNMVMTIFRHSYKWWGPSVKILWGVKVLRKAVLHKHVRPAVIAWLNSMFSFLETTIWIGDLFVSLIDPLLWSIERETWLYSPKHAWSMNPIAVWIQNCEE